MSHSPSGAKIKQRRSTTERAEQRLSPGGGEQVAVDPSEGGQSHGDRHDDGEHSQQLLPECLNSRTTDRLTDEYSPDQHYNMNSRWFMWALMGGIFSTVSSGNVLA